MLYAPSPILIDVARCESGWRQFNEDGSVLTSSTHDRGLFQINESWRKTAAKMGYDIDTEQGNIGFALWLYHKDGLSDWSASRSCWGKSAP